jgi:hypothetical protein
MMQTLIEPNYAHDQNGRLKDSCPRFVLGRTNEGTICRYRFDLPDEIVERMDELFHQEPTVSDLEAVPNSLKGYEEIQHSHQPLTK